MIAHPSLQWTRVGAWGLHRHEDITERVETQPRNPAWAWASVARQVLRAPALQTPAHPHTHTRGAHSDCIGFEVIERRRSMTHSRWLRQSRVWRKLDKEALRCDEVAFVAKMRRHPKDFWMMSMVLRTVSICEAAPPMYNFFKSLQYSALAKTVEPFAMRRS